ncbi:hypothetical protein [Opitutus sp. ER46]|uniref:hypothetical protein n=1 Tax=Opitutus sp. ER46 TaxID=2161864 RepID=UPI000D301CEB|nr:hypothetical protein [Opitutus sp. ER46]PTX97835.1 hypothetical protein DB354_06035 [Opitutus sp. ER46]
MNPLILRQTPHSPLGDETPGGGEPGVLGQTKQKLSSTAASVKSAASETAARAKAEAQRVADQSRQDTASRLGGYGAAMHESAKAFEEQDPNIAWATHQLADRVERFSDYLRERDLGELRMDVEDFARRHPVAFFGGLFLGGFVVGNLIKARPPRSATDELTGREAGNARGSEALSVSEPAFPSGA